MAKNTILVFRFSAMGDVAMCVLVISQFCQQNPESTVVFVSRNHFKAFFPPLKNLIFHAIAPNGAHQGIWGLYQLYRELKKYQPSHIADLHQNLRTQILKKFFSFQGLKIKTIAKGRKEKKQLIDLKNKVLKPLKHTSIRYAEVFNALGFPFQFEPKIHQPKREMDAEIGLKFPFLGKAQIPKIGIFPFAQHPQKIFPIAKMEQILQILAAEKVIILIFGGGQEEKSIAEKWENSFINVHSIIGKISMEQELQIISHLQAMLSMDSAGMHIAALFGLPTLSIWGATHPFAGFTGIGQGPENYIQMEDLPCRPCSIYGNKPCARGDFACMEWIENKQVIKKIKSKLEL